MNNNIVITKLVGGSLLVLRLVPTLQTHACDGDGRL